MVYFILTWLKAHEDLFIFLFFLLFVTSLGPKVAPNFTVVQPTSDSIVVSWEDIPIKDHQGFLKGYLLEFAKGEEGTVKPKDFESGK